MCQVRPYRLLRDDHAGPGQEGDGEGEPAIHAPSSGLKASPSPTSSIRNSGAGFIVVQPRIDQ